MLARALFVAIALFWLTMNALLWRREIGSGPGAGNTVPVNLVWQKILTAPDSSLLVVQHHGKRIGVCHWVTGIGEQWAEFDDENLPTTIEKARGYRLRLDGTAVLEDMTNRVRFEGAVELGDDQKWREFRARVGLRPVMWEIQSSAAEQTIRLKADADGAVFERVLKFSDLQNPTALARELLGPFAGELLAEAGLGWAPKNGWVGPGVRWEAHDDDLRVGHTLVKVYRLHAKLLDRYQVTLWVSRVGEILRAELPDDLVLANDQLTGL